MADDAGRASACLDTPPSSGAPPALGRVNALPAAAAATVLAPCCSSATWLRDVVTGRPYADIEALTRRSTAAVLALDDAALGEAVAGHPRIGERGGEASRREQAGVTGAAAVVVAALAEGNRRYEERFGSVYLVRARGRSAEELLAILRGRLGNDPATERDVVRRELAEITALRLREVVGG